MSQFMGKKLTRAFTFDERKASKPDLQQMEFTKLSKRSMTFSERVSVSNPRRERAHSFSLPDVMYRKHFGMKSEEDVKPFSMFIQNDGVSVKAEDWVEAPAHAVDTLKGPRVENEAVIVVDTFTTGAMLANTLYKMGYQVICVLSADLKDLLKMIPEGLEVSFLATIMLDTTVAEVDPAAALQSVIEQINAVQVPIAAIMAGAETGVELADQLSEAMGMRTNGTALSEARRNKYVMGETIRQAGIRAVKQLLATVWEDIETWLNDWKPNPFKIIVKPMDSAGSDDVTLCLSMEEVKMAFGNIMGKVNGLGIVNKSVLVQEYLEGQEYVIDMVSRDGVHKVAAIWAYDRRPVNGAGFVCFGQRLLTAEEPHCRELIDYQKQVVTALGIRNGPTHGEVKWCQGEPVLVEVGARCHGGEGLWVKLAQEALGYNQVQCTIDAYLYPEKFAIVPDEPRNRLAYVSIKWLINYQEGVFQKCGDREMNMIETSPSYRGHQIFHHPGKHVIKTQNCFSWAGSILLANKSEEQLEEVYARIEEMEKDELFEVQPYTRAPSTSTAGDGPGGSIGGNITAMLTAELPQAVVVVDPFSTGAVLAADLYNHHKYKIIALYSADLEHLERLQSLVPAGLSLTFEAVLPFEADMGVLQAKLAAISPAVQIVAVMAGAETGVELADQLSEAMGMRTNGTALSEARRNKYVMGETIRQTGIRAVKQLKCSEWSSVETFLSTWQPNPFQVIVKPMDSAGSDDVTLCLSMEEVKMAFDRILGRVNGLGLVNQEVLVQEYLEGQEYVIDMVSRDGVHKVAAIWAYDRRPVNGAGFVCFGQRLLTAEEPHCRELIDYQKQVVTALGIRNGPTHGEVKWCQGEPVLVEVGARCHGAEGVWQAIAQSVYGFNQVESAIAAYFNPAAFEAMPFEPTVRYAHGRLMFLILYQEGVVKALNQELLTEIQQLKSFVAMELFCTTDTHVRKTIDCFTFGGIVKLVTSIQQVDGNSTSSSSDLAEQQINQDYDRIREIERIGFITFAD